jgi:carbon-monoxide dehydrogenase small subunit
MLLTFTLNGKRIADDVSPDLPLLEYLREKGCYSVKRGCETSNCGLCTVLFDGKPILSCTQLAVRAEGHHVTTVEGIRDEIAEIGGFLADQGAEQCGYCVPGFLMNVYAMTKELTDPTEQEIRRYLAGNLCRCSGYMGQLRAIRNYLQYKKGAAK